MELYNSDAEAAVLGAVLIDPDVFGKLVQFLRGGDFYNIRNRWIYEAFSALYERREAIDFVTVKGELERMNRLSEVGEGYLVTLIQDTPSSVHAESYARAVYDSGKRRDLVRAASAVAKLAHDVGKPLSEIMEASADVIHQAINGAASSRAVPVSLAISDYYDVIIARSKSGTLPGLPTGILDLDHKLGGGIQSDDLMIVAGRPGDGKTSLLLQMASAFCAQGKRGVIFSLEMSIPKLTNRLIAQRTGLDGQRLNGGLLSKDEWGLVQSAVSDMEKWGLRLDDTAPLSPVTVRARCIDWKETEGLDFIIIDYIQLMTGVGQNREQEIAYISRNLKLLARELNVPVIAAAQVNRASEGRADKRPSKADLRESGAQEQDADLILLLWSDPEKNNNNDKHHVTTGVLDKNRNGPTGEWDMVFLGSQTKFVPVAQTREIDFSRL